MNTQSVVEKFKAGGYDSASGANANPDPTDNGRQLNSKDKGSDESLTLYEVKVNGQVKKFTLDELKSRASKSDAADENFRKAAEIEKASK